MTTTLTNTLESSVLDLSSQISNLFHQENGSLPATVGKISELGNYKWHSETHKREAGENLACAMIAANENMPAQVKTRVEKALMAYDEDVVEKTITRVQALSPEAKLFAVMESVDTPIIVEGENHSWKGQFLNEMHNLTRSDQLVPKHVMKRINQIQNSGIEFNGGYALFWPDEAYGISKKLILKQQYKLFKTDVYKMISVVKRIVNHGSTMTGKFAKSVGDFATSVSLPKLDLPDPVLTGVIEGSLIEKKYCFIEISRWIDSY